jgi:hypothetical protein
MNIIKFWQHFLITQFTLNFGGGGGSPPPTASSSTVTNTNIPEYAQPYVETMLGATQQQLFNTSKNPDGTTQVTGIKPYTPYGLNQATGQAYSPQEMAGNMQVAQNAIAGFTPLQQQAQQGIANLQLPSQYGAASNLTGQAALGSLGAADQSGGFQNQALGYGQAGAQYGGAGAQYGSAGAEQAQRAAMQTARQAGMYGAQGAGAGQQAAGLSNLYGGLGSQAGQTAAGQSNLYGNLGALSGQQYAGQSLGYGGMGAGLGAQAAGAGGQYAQQATSPAALQAYMNPYVQASLEPQLAEIQRQADISGTQQRSGAAKSGAFGGSREALMSSENQRAAQIAKQQAIGQGYDKAFQQAQQAQQYGANLGLQGLQAGMQGTAQGLQGVGQAGQQALAGYGMGLQGAQQAGSQAMQGYGMGLQGAGQAGTQAMQGAQTGLQGVGAQQAAANLGLQGTAQGMQGAGMGMQGAQAGLQGVQGAIGAGQYGLQGLGQAGQLGGQLAGIGGQQLQAQQGIYGLQGQVGAQQQQQQQNLINQAIQNYAVSQQYPQQQLAFMNAQLRGLPLQSGSTQMYQAAPNPVSQIAGLGATGLGAYGAMGGFKAKEGGVVKMAQGGVSVDLLSDEQLKKAQNSPFVEPEDKLAMMGRLQTNQRIEANPEAAKVINAGITDIPTGNLVPQQFNDGGIIAFAKGDVVPPTGGKGEAMKKNADTMDYQDLIRRRLEELDTAPDPFTQSEAARTAYGETIKKREELAPYMALMRGGLKAFGGTSPFANANIGAGAETGFEDYLKNQAGTEADRKYLIGQQTDTEKNRYARKMGNLDTLIKAQGNIDAKTLGALYAKNVGAQTAATQQQANYIRAYNAFGNSLKNEMANIRAFYKQTYQMDMPEEEAYNLAQDRVMKSMPAEMKNMLGFNSSLKPITAADLARVSPNGAPPVNSGANTVPPKPPGYK